MKKHSTHIIDKEAVKFFKNSLPEEHWTVYDVQPDYGKDQKVELVEGDEHTGLTFWVQIKGQKKVSRLKDGSISFRLETKDLDYHTRLQAPMFLVVVDVTKQVGYWVFTQQYERTWLKNVAWRSQEYIQIRLPSSNKLSDLKAYREAVKQAIRYMTTLTLQADLGAERRHLEAIDPRFKIEITVDSTGRHYHFHSDQQIPVGFTYQDGEPDSGKLGEMLDRGLPIVVRHDEIKMSGSPLFERFFEMARGHDVRLEFNKTVEGSANILRKNRAGEVSGRLDAIPCKMTFGRLECRIEAGLPFDLLKFETTVPHDMVGTRPMSLPIDLSSWSGRRLMSLPHFGPLAELFVGLDDGESFTFECFAPGQKLFTGIMKFEEEEPYCGISRLIEMLVKARTVAASRSLNPLLTEGYQSAQSAYEVEMLYDMLIGEGFRRKTTSASVRVTVMRGGLRKFLDAIKNSSSLGTLNLDGDGTFPFLGESVVVDSLEREVTNVRLSTSWKSLRSQMERSPRKREFDMNWKATEATETILRKRRAVEAESHHITSKTG